MTKKEEQELLARVATLEETVARWAKIFKPDQKPPQPQIKKRTKDDEMIDFAHEHHNKPPQSPGLAEHDEPEE